MASATETEHAKNVANFEEIISFCTGYGTSYNPSKAEIELPALNTQFTSTKNPLTAINTALPSSTSAINAREIMFAQISKLVTRIVKAVDANCVPRQVVADHFNWSSIRIIQ